MIGMDMVMESVKNSIRTEHAAVAFSASVTDPVSDGLSSYDAGWILDSLLMDGRVGDERPR